MRSISIPFVTLILLAVAGLAQGGAPVPALEIVTNADASAEQLHKEFYPNGNVKYEAMTNSHGGYRIIKEFSEDGIPKEGLARGGPFERHPVYQEPLANLPSTPVLSGVLPSGTYGFWFAVDYPRNGIMNGTAMLYDNVTVFVQ